MGNNGFHVDGDGSTIDASHKYEVLASHPIDDNSDPMDSPSLHPMHCAPSLHCMSFYVSHSDANLDASATGSGPAIWAFDIATAFDLMAPEPPPPRAV